MKKAAHIARLFSTQVCIANLLYACARRNKLLNAHAKKSKSKLLAINDCDFRS